MRADESGPERESQEPAYISGAESQAGGESAPSREPFHSRLRRGVLAAIALGGLLGGSARYALGLAFPRPEAAFPLTTFVINAGAFLPALLLVYVLDSGRRPGKCGRSPPSGFCAPSCSFTTFSTWMVDTDRLVRHGHYAAAASNVFGSLFAGLAATGLGLVIGRMALARRVRLADRRGRRRYGWWVR
ncbi:CrcB family protein [Streptomyces sp. NPDC005202]|uniref:fluoride efflux transporter FluC n=1 Tax=Streptomyces sp. NPDC005202 TaxID=3157021 RepID=UPI0033A0E4FB